MPSTLSALDVVDEVRRIATATPLWGGFDPFATPVAIFDGERTWLFAHPRLPAGFSPLPGDATVAVWEGLHPSVRAHTACPVDGVWTACLMGFDRHGAPRAVASLVLHEMFHAFQATRHPDWWADESDRYLYPVLDEEALALRRLETRMVRIALDTMDDEQSKGFARSALNLRDARYRRIGADPARYERGVERIEGLAHYVQWLASGRTGTTLPDALYAADDVRRRCYAMGASWAHLLDRHCHGWASDFDCSVAAPVLDQVLSAGMQDKQGDPSTLPAQSVAVVEFERPQATQDIAALRDRYRVLREDFLVIPGWRVVVESCPGNELRTAGTDPMNVTVLGPAEVLHTRYLTVQDGAAGTLEVLGMSALTTSAGRHPLYDGIGRLVVAGLKEEPALSHDGGWLCLKGTGVAARFARATVAKDGKTRRVILQPLTAWGSEVVP